TPIRTARPSRCTAAAGWTSRCADRLTVTGRPSGTARPTGTVGLIGTGGRSLRLRPGHEVPVEVDGHLRVLQVGPGRGQPAVVVPLVVQSPVAAAKLHVD